MKTKNSYNTNYNTLWHNVGWGWELVGRKDQMNRNLKHMHVSFQAKEVSAPKGEEQVFFMRQLPAGTALVEHEARFVLQYLGTAEK